MLGMPEADPAPPGEPREDVFGLVLGGAEAADRPGGRSSSARGATQGGGSGRRMRRLRGGVRPSGERSEDVRVSSMSARPAEMVRSTEDMIWRETPSR